jgi:hypothetical protein
MSSDTSTIARALADVLPKDVLVDALSVAIDNALRSFHYTDRAIEKIVGEVVTVLRLPLLVPPPVLRLPNR